MNIPIKTKLALWGGATVVDSTATAQVSSVVKACGEILTRA